MPDIRSLPVRRFHGIFPVRYHHSSIRVEVNDDSDLPVKPVNMGRVVVARKREELYTFEPQSTYT
jgi:hypothetical protein